MVLQVLYSLVKVRHSFDDVMHDKTLNTINLAIVTHYNYKINALMRTTFAQLAAMTAAKKFSKK